MERYTKNERLQKGLTILFAKIIHPFIGLYETLLFPITRVYLSGIKVKINYTIRQDMLYNISLKKFLIRIHLVDSSYSYCILAFIFFVQPHG